MNLFTLLKINVIMTCIHVINILKSSDISLYQGFFLTFRFTLNLSNDSINFSGQDILIFFSL